MRISIVMRVFLWLLCLVLLAIVGYGVHLALEQERQVKSYSATTTAVVLEKRIDRQWMGKGSESTIRYTPIVKFQFEAQGRQFTTNTIFPGLRTTGRFSARALLERFEVGEETTVYYNPDNPAEACLIRRPSSLGYIFMLLPVIFVSGLVAFLWRSPKPRDVDFNRRKSGWIAALWHVVGVFSIVHYLNMVGANYGGSDLLMFGVYTQLGMIPVCYALPSTETSGFANRFNTAAVLSVICTVVGLLLGLGVGLVAMVLFSASTTFFRHCIGYGMAIPAVVFFLIGFALKPDLSGKRKKGKSKWPKSSPSDQQAESAPQPKHFASMPSPDGAIPYQIDQRPLPSGTDLETLLPEEVGAFHHGESFYSDAEMNDQIYVDYLSGSAGFFSDDGKISFELGVYDDPATAQIGVATWQAETDAMFPDTAQLFSLKTEPSFFKSITQRGAIMSWTRNGYFFAAYAPGGEEDLDRFMKAFPY